MSAELGDPQLPGTDYLNEIHLLPKVTSVRSVF